MFLVLIVFYNVQKVSNGFITKKSIFFQGSRGGPTLSGGGGGPTFPGGREVVQLFPGWNPFVNLYRNTHNLWFSNECFPIETVLFSTHNARGGWGIR